MDDGIGLNQQFRKRTLKGVVDGCKGRRFYYHLSWGPSLRLQGQRQKQRRRRRLLSLLQGSAGGFDCARLPEPSHSLSGSTHHQQQQRLHNSIFPCFIPSKAGHDGQETVSCISPFEQGRSYTLGSRKEIPWSSKITGCTYGTCHPYIIAHLPGPHLFRNSLLNPISGHEIILPGSPFSWFDFKHSLRVTLSLSQSSPLCYTVFIIFDCWESTLLFYRKGDRDWTRLNHPWILDSFITFRGELYALRASEGPRYLLAVYVTHPTPTITEFVMDTSQLPSPKICQAFFHHLVESPNGEELLLLLEIVTLEDEDEDEDEDECDIFPTVGFQVFMADISGKMWIRKETLGDHVLIFKDRQTLFLSAASVGHGFKGNCIYFSRRGQPELKMFDLDSETMTDVSIPYPSGQIMFLPNDC